MNSLTSDNTSFPRPILCDVLKSFAVNCNNPLPDPVLSYVRDSLSPGTLRVYRQDLDRFLNWGGLIPASDRMIVTYLVDHVDTHAVATLTRWLASLAKAHRAAGLESPTNSLLVKAAFRGIKRRHGTAQRQAAPLLRDDLFLVLNAMGDGMRDDRDRALLLVGFAGGFRRSELVGLDRHDVEHVRHGVIVHLRQSKTDQVRQGTKVAIPHGRTRHCPIKALEDWFARSKIDCGPVFQGLNRHGQRLGKRLSGEAVSLIVKERVAIAGFDPQNYSGHSLRAGLATSAAQAGVPTWKIRAQTRHASDVMLNRYIRDGDLFTENAVGALL